MDNFFEQVKKTVFNYIPTEFSKEKKEANGVVIALALMTMADGEAEDSEIESAIEFIQNNSHIERLGMTEFSVDLYRAHIETLQSADTNVKLISVRSNLLRGLKGLENKDYILEMCEEMVNQSSNSGGEEQIMLNKIRKAF